MPLEIKHQVNSGWIIVGRNALASTMGAVGEVGIEALLGLLQSWASLGNCDSGGKNTNRNSSTNEHDVSGRSETKGRK